MARQFSVATSFLDVLPVLVRSTIAFKYVKLDLHF